MTINEFAVLAKVSKGTVSKALNNQPGVGPETRERIHKLALELDYQPNSSAQALASNRTESIGLVIPHNEAQSLDGFYWSALISGITRAAAEFGYSLTLFTPKKEGSPHEIYHRVLKSRRIDGIIIGSELIDLETARELMNHSVPYVLIGRNPLLPHYYVDVDNKGGAAMLAKCLIEKEAKKIGFLGGPENYPYMQERFLGFKSALDEAGLSSDIVAFSNYYSGTTRETTQSLLKKHPDGLIISAGGRFLLDALCAVQNFDRETPILVASFDDIPYLDFLEPPVTSISQPTEELGQEAFSLLLSLLMEKEEALASKVIPVELVKRW